MPFSDHVEPGLLWASRNEIWERYQGGHSHLYRHDPPARLSGGGGEGGGRTWGSMGGFFAKGGV